MQLPTAVRHRQIGAAARYPRHHSVQNPCSFQAPSAVCRDQLCQSRPASEDCSNCYSRGILRDTRKSKTRRVTSIAFESDTESFARRALNSVTEIPGFRHQSPAWQVESLVDSMISQTNGSPEYRREATRNSDVPTPSDTKWLDGIPATATTPEGMVRACPAWDRLFWQQKNTPLDKKSGGVPGSLRIFSRLPKTRQELRVRFEFPVRSMCCCQCFH